MHIARLEFKRIQTFLFSSPRLKDMLGANALLGNVIRKQLPEIVVAIRKGQPLALPEAFQNLQAAPTDPLYNQGDWYEDNPAKAWGNGVLSRDGGHFYAAFDTKEQGDLFLNQATTLIQSELPGVSIEFSLDEESQLNDRSSVNDEKATDQPQRIEEDNFPFLPIFQPCEISSVGIAEKVEVHKEENAREKKIYLSSASHKKRDFVKDKGKKSADIASQLMAKYRAKNPHLQPGDLQELVGSDYLGLILADGNSMGQKFKEYLANHEKSQPLNWLEKQAIAEIFFYQARSAIRIAVDKALTAILQQEKEKKTLPFQLLMLGGDDILIACRSTLAFDILNDIDAHLEESYLDGERITLGSGVVFASHNLPFYRFHHIAEELASSAKILFRSNENLGSTVDWQVITQAWIDNPISDRQESQIIHYNDNDPTKNHTLILTKKPYPIRGKASLDKLSSHASGIIKAIKNKKDKTQSDTATVLARSQLRYMQSQLKLGKNHAEQCFLDLPEELRKELTKHLNQLHADTTDQNTDENTLPWLPITINNNTNQYSLTLLSDLIELIEIPNHQNTTHQTN